MTSSNGNIFRVTGPLCGEFTGPGEFPAQRPVTRSFDVPFDLRSNKRLSKQWRGWWFETQSCPLWRHRNDNTQGFPNFYHKWINSMSKSNGHFILFTNHNLYTNNTYLKYLKLYVIMNEKYMQESITMLMYMYKQSSNELILDTFSVTYFTISTGGFPHSEPTTRRCAFLWSRTSCWIYNRVSSDFRRNDFY